MTTTITKEIKAQPQRLGERQFEYVLSTPEIDRMGDCMSQTGWDLTNYRRAPVVLWAHKHDDLPIGRCPRIGVAGGQLRGVVEFPPEGTYPFADQVRALVEKGYLSTSSVGFRPVEATPHRHGKGISYTRCELLEWSIVPVPANAGALLQASRAVPDREAVLKWVAERAIPPPLRPTGPLDDGRHLLAGEFVVPTTGHLGAASVGPLWSTIRRALVPEVRRRATEDWIEVDGINTRAELDALIREAARDALRDVRRRLQGGR